MTATATTTSRPSIQVGAKARTKATVRPSPKFPLILAS